MSWRRLWSLIERLPRSSHYALAVTGERAAWGYTEHLLAHLFDALQVGNWMYASAHTKSRVKRPKPLERPGERKALKGGSYTREEMRKILDSWGTTVREV